MWIRLAGRIMAKHYQQDLVELFSPIQLGVGVSGGCEKIIFACNQLASAISKSIDGDLDPAVADHVIVEVDTSYCDNPWSNMILRA